jgi:uncharacterized membrane protein YgcG
VLYTSVIATAAATTAIVYRFLRIRPLKRNAAALAVARTIAAPVEKSDSHEGKKGRDNSKIKVARRPASLDATAASVYSGPTFYDSGVSRDKKKVPLKTPLIEGMHSPKRDSADTDTAAAKAGGSSSGGASAGAGSSTGGGSSKSGLKRPLSPGPSSPDNASK